mmetsp:Transcript_3356/g.5004  ORF Transcript_3356/g.5004 Transcript_3356/m.5004 type:complete len:87 (-) Transcript_3356:1312-1572(-)
MIAKNMAAVAKVIEVSAAPSNTSGDLRLIKVTSVLHRNRKRGPQPTTPSVTNKYEGPSLDSNACNPEIPSYPAIYSIACCGQSCPP